MLSAAAALLGMLACTSADPQPRVLAERALADGGVVGDLLDEADVTILVLARANQCFTCSGDVSRWFQLPRRPDRRVLFLAATEPAERERAALTIARIPLGGVLAEASTDIPLPSVFLYRHGTLVRSGAAADTAFVNALLAEVD